MVREEKSEMGREARSEWSRRIGEVSEVKDGRRSKGNRRPAR